MDQGHHNTMAHFDNPIIVKVALLTSIAIAVAMFTVTIIFAIQLSTSLFSSSQGTVTDFSEVILATFTAFLALCLVVLVVIVGLMLRKGKESGARNNE
jgi:hypothetical protein